MSETSEPPSPGLAFAGSVGRRLRARLAKLFAFPLIVAGCGLDLANAQSGDFYARKTINLHIGQLAGGGYDHYGRLLARHIGRHIPGAPTVVPQNMPGAGGLKVANFAYQAAPQDGTVIAIAAEAIALEQALGGAGTDYDANKLGWIGRLSGSASIFFTSGPSRVKSIADAREHESVFGSTGVTGITAYTPRALNQLAGTKFKVVTGYSGSAAVLLAMERGEVDGGFAIWPEFAQQKPEWIQPKRINILYIVAPARAAELPDVPTTAEVGQSPEGRDILKFLGSTSEIGRSFFTTPNMPADRLALLRQAFQDTVKDTAFREDAARSGLRIEPMTGDDLQTLVAGIVGFPRPLVEKAKAARN